jgi:circadian clock protein KaiC
MDVWVLLGNPEANGERNRTLQIVKARGMAHSNQVREFVMTAHGVVLLEVKPSVRHRTK